MSNNYEPIGQDIHGNDLYPGDEVFVLNGDNSMSETENQTILWTEKQTIEFGEYREKFDCGIVVGYYIPDNCIKILNGGEND